MNYFDDMYDMMYPSKGKSKYWYNSLGNFKTAMNAFRDYNSFVEPVKREYEMMSNLNRKRNYLQTDMGSKFQYGSSFQRLKRFKKDPSSVGNQSSTSMVAYMTTDRNYYPKNSNYLSVK